MSNNITFYRICCNFPTECSDVFVGYTTNIIQKKHVHKINSKNNNKKCPLYTAIRAHGGWSNWSFIVIKSIMLDNKETIKEYEAKYMMQFGHTLRNGSSTGSGKLEQIMAQNKQLEQKQYEIEQKQHIMEEKHEADAALIKEIISQNTNLTKQIVELSKENKQAYVNNTSTNTNIHNCYNSSNSHNTNNIDNKFNLNFFLNETCKDAYNLSDFLKQMSFCSDDLEHTGEVGFAGGMSHIFLKGLEKSEIDKRPIHCTDLKRETLYVKENGVWGKEDIDRSHMMDAVRQLGRCNLRTLSDWIAVHPDYKDYDSKTNTQYMRMIGNAMPGCTDDEIKKNYKKIIQNVIRGVPIPKY